MQTCVIKWSVSNNKLCAMLKLHWVLNKSLFFYRRVVPGTWKLLEISANSNRLQESRVPGYPMNIWTEIYKHVTLDHQLEQRLCSVWEIRVVPCWPACMVRVIATLMFVKICSGVVQCWSDGDLYKTIVRKGSWAGLGSCALILCV